MKREAGALAAWTSLAWLALCASACGTEITVKNSVPSATLENVRWVTESGTVYTPSDQHLLPGQESKPVTIPEPDQDATGHLEFELLVEGRKVALKTDNVFRSVLGESTAFEVWPKTAARNPLASSATSGDPQPANP
ncbi:MAG: hypothetical protein HY898_00585 [Deltaproteobacteria bacterium]|nr:hypothetical protein [Deltaproteobacteria bacterium]